MPAPSSTTIAQGASIQTFPLNTNTVTGTSPAKVTITAGANGVEKTETLAVKP